MSGYYGVRNTKTGEVLTMDYAMNDLNKREDARLVRDLMNHTAAPKNRNWQICRLDAHRKGRSY